MKTKIYLGDWFYNAGIIGFIRILKNSNKDFIKIADNYIEFDTTELKDFNKCYFKFFFDKYNIANKVKDKFDKILEERKDNFETNKKYIKMIIKTQLGKIKKFDEQTYNLIKQAYLKIDEAKNTEELEEIRKIVIENIKKDNINKKLTMNYFKNILSKKYFGQQSFLNVTKTKLSFEEQEEIMYRDYISNIIEPKKPKKMKQCCMCGNENCVTTNYSEGNFIPLAVSSENMKNFFWNQNVNLPICDICKLILFCIPEGVTEIIKIVKEYDGYKENEVLSFVNYDTNISTLLRTNNYFSNISKFNKYIENPYASLILDIVSQNKKISIWQLQNIFVVEFEAEYMTFSRMEYFNIKKHVANFFIKYSENTLKNIKDYGYKLQIVDYILKNKDISKIVNDRLRTELEKEDRYGYNSYLATKINLIINLLKKEESYMDEQIEKSNKKIAVLYGLGTQIHTELKNRGEERKLDGYTYKMLNCVKAGNKKEFMDTIIRLHMSMGKDVSPIFIEIMQDGNLDFTSIGHSFLSGLISNKYVKKEVSK